MYMPHTENRNDKTRNQSSMKQNILEFKNKFAAGDKKIVDKMLFNVIPGLFQ